MSEKKELRVHVSFDGFEADLIGSPEEVASSFNRILAQQIPTLELAKALVLNYSLAELTNMFQEYVRITPEGPRVITDAKLSDKMLIMLQLVAVKIGFEAAKLETYRATLQDLERLTGLNPKSISSRLSELVKAGHVDRLASDNGVFYYITTAGVNWLAKSLGKLG
jgi:DNA-binding MarR family transcriptional regulator